MSVKEAVNEAVSVRAGCFFFEVYCFFKLRLRRSGYGVKEAEEWCESFWGFSVFWRERFWLFGEGL